MDFGREKELDMMNEKAYVAESGPALCNGMLGVKGHLGL